MKRLIINADDFGFTRDVNAGIISAHLHGILTSTTLMATGDAFEDAVRWAHQTTSLDVGCHLVLVQGRSLLTGKPFPESPQNVVLALARRQLHPYAELRAQIERIIAAGLRPTHLDSHKHTHIIPAVFSAVVRLAHEFGIPYVRLPLDDTAPFARIPCALAGRYYRRIARANNIAMTDHFRGFRLTGLLTQETLAAALKQLPQGTTEFMCHPGFAGPELHQARTRLKEARQRELQALLAPRIRALLAEQGITLSTFTASRA